MKQAKVTFQ